MASVKIENAPWIVTVDSNRRVLKDSTIIIEDGTITAIEKSDNLKSTPADRVIDARNKLVTPGFVNCHMHISYAHAVRGIFPDDLPQQIYLDYVFKLQQAMTPEQEYYTSLLAIIELLKNGCTTILDPGSITSLESGLKAIEESGIRAIVGNSFVDKPNPIHLEQVETEKAIRITEATIKNYDKRLNGRVRAWAMPFSPDYCTEESIIAAKKLADDYQTGITLHTANTEAGAENFRKANGLRPIEFLAKKGILAPNVLLAHALSANDQEIDMLRENNAKIVHCPSVAVRGEGATKIGRFPEMLDKGIAVGLGNDAANSSYHLDPIRIMYLAAVLYKDARRDRRVMPCEAVLEMGTINGAKCLLQDGSVGSIEVGKKADLVIFDTRRPEWRSLFNPVSNLVYSADGRSVDTVLVDGKVVVQDGEVTFADEKAICDKVQAAGEDIIRKVGVSFKTRWVYT